MKRELSPWGKQCKMQMIALGKTLKDLSSETKFSCVYISAIINGRVAAPEETVLSISKALQVDMTLAK